MKKVWLIWVILSFCGTMVTAQTKETHAFAERDSVLYLDVHRPLKPRDDKAAVIAVFGGGFFAGARDNQYQLALADSLTHRGYTVISTDYRLGLKDSLMVAEHNSLFKLTDLFQYCIDIATEDCADAVAWTIAHASELDIDPSKIVLTGSSAGAITVLQLDYCRANHLPLVSALPEGWKPAAVIPYSGGILCKKKDLKYDTPPAPTLLMHGTKDKIVAYKRFGIPFNKKLFGSKSIDKAMKQQGIPHWFIRFDGIGHEVASWFPGSVDVFCNFADQALKGRSSSLDASMSDALLQPTRWTNMSLRELYQR